jgi:hypothetical protein
MPRYAVSGWPPFNSVTIANATSVKSSTKSRLKRKNSDYHLGECQTDHELRTAIMLYEPPEACSVAKSSSRHKRRGTTTPCGSKLTAGTIPCCQCVGFPEGYFGLNVIVVAGADSPVSLFLHEASIRMLSDVNKDNSN